MLSRSHKNQQRWDAWDACSPRSAVGVAPGLCLPDPEDQGGVRSKHAVLKGNGRVRTTDQHSGIKKLKLKL